MEEYIDIRNTKKRYEAAVASLECAGDVSARNRELLLRFLRDAALGKTILNRSKKQVSPARRLVCISHLRTLMRFVQKDLDRVTEEDMERFIEALDSGKSFLCSGRHNLKVMALMEGVYRSLETRTVVTLEEIYSEG